jgi:hypothetical protein
MLRSLADILAVDLAAIPEQLKELNRWVLWKPLPSDDDPSVLTKSPFDCRFTDDRASSTRPETWNDFEAAAAAYLGREHNGTGGIMIALGDGLAGVDLDNAIDSETGDLTAVAQQIVNRMQSYTELSVSGTGIRIFVRAPEAPGKKFGNVEVYTRARFLTVTGRQIPGTPSTIEDRGAELAALRDELDAARQAGRPARAPRDPNATPLNEAFPGVTVLGVPDDEILTRASEVCGERFDNLWSGDDSAYESRSQADLALAGDLAFMCGPGEEERVESLMRQSGLVREKWDRDDYLPRFTIPRAFEGRDDFYRWEILPGIGRGRYRGAHVTESAAGPGPAVEAEDATAVCPAVDDEDVGAEPDDDGSSGAPAWMNRPTIVVGPELDAILAELEGHLAELMFQRGEQLVQVTVGQEERREADGAADQRGSRPAAITLVTVEQVQRLMSRHVRFVKPTGGTDEATEGADQATGDEATQPARRRGRKRRRHEQVAAPKNLAQLFAKCGQWQNIPHLKGLAACPFMRADGVVVSTPGYDPVSGVFLVASGIQWQPVPENPTPEDVAEAVVRLHDLVADFPFGSPANRSAWLASLLTVAARPAIDGPAPMLVVDANRRGTGKSKLGRLTGIVTAGGQPKELTWTADEKEMDNLLVSLLRGGSYLGVFDNLIGNVRNPVLERFLTCDYFSSRKFFGQDLITLPNRTTLVITGNNLTIRGDLGRRIIRCRLETTLEAPETRDGFRHADIEAYAVANQPALLAAALTILRAHAVAGFAACPVRVTNGDGTVTEVPARPVGSFEEWDRVVRHAILRAGLADPMVTQDEAREEDEDDVKLRALLEAWHDLNRTSPWTLSRLLEEVFGADDQPDTTPNAVKLAEAIREITDAPPGRVPEPKLLAYKLRDAKDKTLGGFTLRRAKRGNNGVRYIVECSNRLCGDCQRRRAAEGTG